MNSLTKLPLTLRRSSKCVYPHLTRSSRTFATGIPRPPPPTEQPAVETFSETSRPRPYYAKHPPHKELPLVEVYTPFSYMYYNSKTGPHSVFLNLLAFSPPDLVMKNRWPYILAFVVVGVAGWGAFMGVVTNQEKMSSSVVRQIMRSVREDVRMQEVLGDAIRPQPEWWLNGDPIIHGKISQLQGNVDVSFRIRGSKGSGTLYFTSIRREKGVPFTILRFKVICDDGSTIHVDTRPV